MHKFGNPPITTPGSDTAGWWKHRHLAHWLKMLDWKQTDCQSYSEIRLIPVLHFLSQHMEYRIYKEALQWIFTVHKLCSC